MSVNIVKPGGASPADVWANPTRTLTAFTGTPRGDLVGSDAAIWAHVTRTLTSLAGAPRSDLLGEDASFEAGTGARKAALDKALVTQAPTEGTLAADGTEQNLVEKTGTLEFNLEGFVDMTNMAAGDTTVIRHYAKIKPAGAYVKFAEFTYTGAQDIKLLHVITLPARYGLKVTLQQNAGTNRNYDYEFFQRARTA